MATNAQEAQAKQGIVTSEQIEYGQKLYSHPEYLHIQKQSNTLGTPVFINSSNPNNTVNLDSIVWNPAQTFMQFQLYLPPQAGGGFFWIYANGWSAIQRLQHWADGNTEYMIDLDNLNNYMNLISPIETSLDEFMTRDEKSQFYPSNVPVNSVPALRPGNNVTVNGVNAYAPYLASKNYLEPAYLKVYPASTTQGVVIDYLLRLSDLKNTFFSVDKDMYYGGRISYLQTYFSTIDKIGYISTNGTDPGLGTISSIIPVNGVNSAQILNFQILVAKEMNETMARRIKEDVSRGVEYLIPWVKSLKLPGQSSTQSITFTFQKAYGLYLRKVIYAPFNNQEKFQTAYDHSNDVYSPNGLKIQQYLTQLNGTNQQQIVIDCTGNNGSDFFYDFVFNKKFLKKSVLQNRNMYAFQWFHIDDFCNFGPEADQQGRDNLISGVQMTTTDLNWTFNGTQMGPLSNTFSPGTNIPTGLNLQHYAYGVFSKLFRMDMNGVRVIP